MYHRKISKIDKIFPDFVRDIASSRRAGMTFTRAILFTSKGNYGLLTPEIQKIAQQISWGSSKHPLSKLAVKRELEPEDMELIKNKLKELGYMD